MSQVAELCALVARHNFNISLPCGGQHSLAPEVAMGTKR